jgi:acetyltransferase-like isoleucine patch superfamily enzyme
MISCYYAKFLKKIRGAAVVNSQIHKTSKVESGSSIVNVIMGKYSFCGYNCDIFNCQIGSFCSIANGVTIGGAFHPMDWVSTSPVFYKGRDSVKQKFAEHVRSVDKNVIIEHDVWIGGGVFIKQGVQIGIGAVVGMGSVVVKDVMPYSIVAGNPAKEIRKRFDSKIIECLLDSRWWEFDDEQLRYYAQYFTDPVKFLKHLK